MRAKPGAAAAASKMLSAASSRLAKPKGERVKKIQVMYGKDFAIVILLVCAAVELYIRVKNTMAAAVMLQCVAMYVLMCDERAEAAFKAQRELRCEACEKVIPLIGGLCQECDALARQLYEQEPIS